MDKQECISKVRDKYNEILDIIRDFDPDIDHVSIFSIKEYFNFMCWYEKSEEQVIDDSCFKEV